MPDLKEQAIALQTTIAAKEAEAATKWVEFDTLRKSAVDEGVDFTKDADAFKKLDEASKGYDTLRDEVATMKENWGRLVAMAAEGEPGSPFKADQGPVDLDTLKRSKAWGEMVVESDIYKNLIKSGRLDNSASPIGSLDGVKVASRQQVKSLLTGASDTSAGAFVFPDIQSEWVGLPRRPLTLAGLVTVGTTNSDTVEWVEQDTRTNNAAETAEATATGDGSGAAPESATTFVVRNTVTEDITHFIPATRRAIADAEQLQTIINSEVGDGVRERLDTQMASGDGSSPNLRGIYNTSGILTRALGTDSRSDAVHKSITQIRLGFFEPTAVGIHPTDYQSIRLEKDANGNYIYGPPSQAGPPTIWGLTPVVSPVFTQGTPIVGNYAMGATLWLREDLMVALSDQHSDYFVRRMVAVLGVLRAAFGVKRPKCFGTVTGF
jgi:HK97 family phage major capsid protein